MTKRKLSQSMISALRIISSVAAYLDTYLDVYPDTTPGEFDVMEEEEQPPDEAESPVESVDSEEEQSDDNDSQSISSDEERLPLLDPKIFHEVISIIPILQTSSVSTLFLETINDISWTLSLRVPTWQKWKAVSLNFLTEIAIPKLPDAGSFDEETLRTFLGCMAATAKVNAGDLFLDIGHLTILQEVYNNVSDTEIRCK